MNNSEVGKGKSSKIRRMNVASSKMLTDRDSNDGCERCKNLAKLFSEKIAKLTELIEKQNKFVVGVLAEHTVLLEQVTNKEKGAAAAASRFPLKTDEDIAKLEGEINDINRDCYIAAVQYLLQGEVGKNFEKVFSRSLYLQCNIYGIAGKKCLKDFSEVFTVLKKAIGKTSVDAEAEIRKALQVAKKRHFRMVSFAKS
ncbi:PREDICTED: uncharacterized protein LOC108373363 [Rhagoletis zephyria]|uniref:uncharacterized protein LOC108373363 n=1 Tax=Rhagoletis zephyria TaxID=28612 RepID=UPI0008119568|nr:PREDICTED: uncharacterized protein LOC108373363 [Rhagoletis zephyria]